LAEDTKPPVEHPAGSAHASPEIRARIVDAMVEVVVERGYRGASVGLVVARAKVSRRTFYEQFDGLEECFVAVVDLGLRVPSELITRAFAGEDGWRDGMRAALATLLEFFDSEPQLTRVWFGEILAAGAWALEHRERNIAFVRSAIVEYWSASSSLRADPVLAKGVMASVFDALTTHVVTRSKEPFITLLAPLTSLVVSPFLPAEAVKMEVDRAEQMAQAILAERYPLPLQPRPGALTAAGRSDGQVAGHDGGLPPILANPNARRARLCVLFLAEHPGASNYQIGADVGIVHQGQTSKLLARLADSGLLSKQAGTPGRPNAWSLTPLGEQVARTLAGR
jgi:AcrR family transcriptional regulator